MTRSLNALGIADHQSKKAHDTDDMKEAAFLQQDAMIVLLRQLLVEVADLRKDVMSIRDAKGG